jgi:hypothetical protein
VAQEVFALTLTWCMTLEESPLLAGFWCLYI